MHTAPSPTRCTAFEGQRRIATGDLAFVVRKTKPIADTAGHLPILVFDDETSAQIEIDFRGTTVEIIQNLLQHPSRRPAGGNAPPRRTPGRPKLGVIAREVTLLPGQWDWLDARSGGASAALRRLVHEARKTDGVNDRVRQSQDSIYKFMTVMAGNLPGFEEALRAFYRKDHARFAGLIGHWPKDIRLHIKKLVLAARQKSR